VTAALAAALRAAAAGIPPDEAATGLLITSGCFLHRADFTSRFTRTALSISDGLTPLAWTSWDTAITALDTGQLPASSGETAILRIAASLAAGHPVSLRDTIPRLDPRNLQLVSRAIRHAAGHH
jgi:hypothetical protein